MDNRYQTYGEGYYVVGDNAEDSFQKAHINLLKSPYFFDVDDCRNKLTLKANYSFPYQCEIPWLKFKGRMELEFEPIIPELVPPLHVFIPDHEIDKAEKIGIAIGVNKRGEGWYQIKNRSIKQQIRKENDEAYEKHKSFVYESLVATNDIAEFTKYYRALEEKLEIRNFFPEPWFGLVHHAICPEFCILKCNSTVKKSQIARKIMTTCEGDHWHVLREYELGYLRSIIPGLDTQLFF